MNCLKILFFFLFSYYGYTLDVKKSFNQFLLKTNTELWKSQLDQRIFFFNRNLETVISLLEKNPNNQNKYEFLEKNPEVMYTATNCKYADIVSDMFQLFFEYISYCLYMFDNADFDNDNGYPKLSVFLPHCFDKTITNFYTIKQDIVKIIHVLFKISDENPALKTSDPGLLKTLLSINLFLYYVAKEKPFIVYDEKKEEIFYKITKKIKIVNLKKSVPTIRNLPKIIYQIINLVEQYRFKNCFVRHPYTYKLEKRNHLLTEVKRNYCSVGVFLELFLTKLRSLIIFSKLDYLNYYNMYNPDSVSFKSLLRVKDFFIGNANVEWNEKKIKLRDAYSHVKQSYDIVEVFKFQNTLLKVIANIFYRKLSYLLNDPQKDMSEFRDFLDALNTFVEKIIPNNCLSDVCQPIISVKHLLASAIAKGEDKLHEEKSALLKNKLKNLMANDNIIWTSNEDQSINEKLSVTSLVNGIRNNGQFKYFSQVIKILSYESYTNIDYYIVHEVHRYFQWSDYNPNDFIKLNQDVRIELRYNLFLFRMVLANKYGNIETTYDKPEEMEIKFSLNFDLEKYSESHSKRSSYLSAISSLSSSSSTVSSSSPLLSSVDDDADSIVFAYIFSYIIGLQEQYADDRKITRALLPLLIQLRYIFNVSRKIGKLDLVRLDHTCLLVINTIEGYELKNIVWPHYSSIIYDTIMSEESRVMLPDKKPDFQAIETKLKEVAESYGILSNTDVSSTLTDIYDRYVYGMTSKKYDNKLHYYWNGRKQIGNDILREVQRGVIDANDLIRYQWFAYKYFVAKVFLNVRHALAHYKTHKIYDDQDIDLKMSIVTSLGRIAELGLPPSVLAFVTDTIDSVVEALEQSNRLEELALGEQLVKNRIEDLGVFETLAPSKPVDFISKELATDIEMYQSFLNGFIDDRQITLITEKMDFSSTLPPK